MLYDIILKTFKEIYPNKKMPKYLTFRLKNYGARELNYLDFRNYFNLENRYEVLNFILDDNNMTEILRYASNHISDTFKYVYEKQDYEKDAKIEHKHIDISLNNEEKGYQK